MLIVIKNRARLPKSAEERAARLAWLRKVPPRAAKDADVLAWFHSRPYGRGLENEDFDAMEQAVKALAFGLHVQDVLHYEMMAEALLQGKTQCRAHELARWGDDELPRVLRRHSSVIHSLRVRGSLIEVLCGRNAPLREAALDALKSYQYTPKRVVEIERAQHIQRDVKKGISEGASVKDATAAVAAEWKISVCMIGKALTLVRQVSGDFTHPIEQRARKSPKIRTN